MFANFGLMNQFTRFNGISEASSGLYVSPKINANLSPND